MPITPRIALLKAHDSEVAKIAALFSHYPYELQLVTSISEISEKIENSFEEFDAVVIGSKLENGDDGFDLCESFKAQPNLAPIPVIGIVMKSEPAVIRSFYTAGAEVVLVEPKDAGIVYQQVEAIARFKRLYDEKVRQNKDAMGLHSSTIAALNCVREGIVLFDSNHKPLFLNRSARLLLGIGSRPDRAERGKAREILAALISAVASKTISDLGEEVPSSEARYLKLEISRVDGQSFQAATRITPIYGEGSLVSGFTVAISDLAELEHLSSILLQHHKTRALCMFLGSAAFGELSRKAGGIPVGAASYIEKMLNQEQLSTNLEPVLAALIDILDLAISSEVQLKIDTSKDYKVAMKFSDLFQLLGQIILYAAEQVGCSGKISVTFEQSEEPVGLLMVLACEWPFVTPLLEDDYLSSLRAGSFHWTSGTGSQDEAIIPHTIQKVQEIAGRYNTDIQFKRILSGMKLRVLLPM